MLIRIQRFNPEVNAKPYWQNFEIDAKKVGAIMVLDALLWLKNHVDETLAFRRSCREGVCGSDGMNINGSNALACITPLGNQKTLVVKPFPGMRVERDLITDMTNFFKQYESIKPYLQNDDPEPAKEHLQSPKERAKLDGLYECILCGCCSSACPSYWWNPEKFAGPAALLQSARFVMDSRDTATAERVADLDDHYKVLRCKSIMNCVSVCPKKLNPTQAIALIRDEMLVASKK